MLSKNCEIMAECRNQSLLNITAPPVNLSDEAIVEQIVHHYAMEVGVPVVCAFGLVGNILNLMVLTREKIHRTLTKMEKSAHMGLIALACSDFMFCLLALLFSLLPRKEVYNEPNVSLYYDWLGPSFITIFIITSTWLIVVMAGERYLAVCHPFKARKVISLKRTRITIIIIYGLCMCSCLPLFFENVIERRDCVNGSSIYVQTERKTFGKQAIVLRRLLWAIFFDFIPFVALLYCNACLIWKIHKAKKLRKNMAPMQDDNKSSRRKSSSRDGNSYNSSRHEKNSLRPSETRPLSSRGKGQIMMMKDKSIRPIQTTRVGRKHPDSALNSVTATLVAVVVLFLILVSPSEILKFIYLWSQKDGSRSHAFRIIRAITNFMQALNFSINFILYCAVNKSFRQTLASIFCFCNNSMDTIISSPTRPKAPTIILHESSS